MNLSEKAMNASEKRILKLAIILFIIGLTVRYLPWGLPSIETFEVGDAIVVANAPPGLSSDAFPLADANLRAPPYPHCPERLSEHFRGRPVGRDPR